MKHYLLHLRAPIRALFALLAFSAVSLSVEAQAQETSCYVVFSNSKDFKTKVEIPMVAALYRDKDKDGNDLSADIKHTKDNSRWQISLKYDDPRWKDISDGTVYWYIKTSGGVLSVRAPMRRIWTMAKTTVIRMPLSMAVCSIRVWVH